jgi:hypothetical protein
MLQNSENEQSVRNPSQTGTAAAIRALPFRVVHSRASSDSPSRMPRSEDTDPNGPGPTLKSELNSISTQYGGRAKRSGSRKHATT